MVCPAHGTFFDLATGDVKGEWCPKVIQEKRSSSTLFMISLV